MIDIVVLIGNKHDADADDDDDDDDADECSTVCHDQISSSCTDSSVVSAVLTGQYRPLPGTERCVPLLVAVERLGCGDD